MNRLFLIKAYNNPKYALRNWNITKRIPNITYNSSILSKHLKSIFLSGTLLYLLINKKYIMYARSESQPQQVKSSLASSASEEESESLANVFEKNYLLINKTSILENNPDYADVLHALKEMNVQITELNDTDDHALAKYLRGSGKSIDIIGTNADGDVIELSANEEEYLIKLFNFYKKTHAIRKDNLNNLKDLIKDLKDNERIVISYIPNEDSYQPVMHAHDEYNNKKIKDIKSIEKFYRELKYAHFSKNTTFFVFKELEAAKYLNFSNDDIGEIYMIKKTSGVNNNDTNNRIDGIKLHITKIELPENLAYQAHAKNLPKQTIFDIYNQQLHKNSLDGSNFFQTQLELDNILRLAKEVKIKKFLIYYSKQMDDKFHESIEKLIKAKKELNLDDICIIATNNAHLLKTKLEIMPEKFNPTLRYIEEIDNKDKPLINAPFLKDYKLELTDENLHVLKTEKRFRFNETKLTKQRLKKFIMSAYQHQFDDYYETENKKLIYNSANIVSNNFETEVLENQQDVIVEFFKPLCPSCSILGDAYEEFANIIKKVQKYWRDVESGKIQYNKYDNDNIINAHHIKNPSKFMNIKVGRYNIYNESPRFPSPSSTPLIFIFKNGQKTSPILIDLISERIKINDSDKVIKYLVRYIDETL